jgi:hypothetical protein
MFDLKAIVNYVVEKHPKNSRLDIFRLYLIMYLADWRYSIQYDNQLTNLKWKIEDFTLKLQLDSFSEMLLAFNQANNIVTKWFISSSSLTNKEKKILDFVIEVSAGKEIKELYEFVCSTYPLIGQSANNSLDLPNLAKEYGDVKKFLVQQS